MLHWCVMYIIIICNISYKNTNWNTLFTMTLLDCVSTLLGNVMVQPLHLGVVSQQVQALAVGFPQELNPGSEEQPISTILGVFSTHSTQEHTEIIFIRNILSVNRSMYSYDIFTGAIGTLHIIHSVFTFFCNK